MEIKIINNWDSESKNFEPQLIAYMKDGELVGEIAFNLIDCQVIERELTGAEIGYVIGPVNKTISLTNIASLNDLRQLV